MRSGKVSSTHFVLPGEGTRSKSPRARLTWTRSTAPTTLAETGNGTRPEHDGPEQGRGREGLGRVARSPAGAPFDLRRDPAGDQRVEVNRCPVLLNMECTRWLHPAQAGRAKVAPGSGAAWPLRSRTEPVAWTTRTSSHLVRQAKGQGKNHAGLGDPRMNCSATIVAARHHFDKIRSVHRFLQEEP